MPGEPDTDQDDSPNQATTPIEERFYCQGAPWALKGYPRLCSKFVHLLFKRAEQLCNRHVSIRLVPRPAVEFVVRVNVLIVLTLISQHLYFNERPDRLGSPPILLEFLRHVDLSGQVDDARNLSQHCEEGPKLRSSPEEQKEGSHN